MGDDWFLTWENRKLGENALDWQIAQWNFVRTMLTGPLHWLGLVDLSMQDDEIVEIRLRGLADLYWERSQSDPVERPALPAETLAPRKPPPNASDKKATAKNAAAKKAMLEVDAEGRLIVDPASMSARGHALLDKIARLTSTEPTQFVYTLDVEAVHHAFEDGNTLHDLEALWQEVIAIPMPASVQTQLQAWGLAYGRTRIYTGVTLIELSDDFALAELKAVTALDVVMIAELSPRLVLIPQNAVNDLVAQLEKAGYTPKQVV